MSQPVATPQRQLLDRVVWVRRQVMVQALVEGATRGALLGAPVWVAAVIAVKSLQVAAFELLFFASAGALYRFRQVPDRRGAAHHADTGLGLEDRLLTAMDCLGDDSPMAQLQRRDALEAFGAAGHQTLRSAWPRWSLLSLSLVVVAAGAARLTTADEVGRDLVVVLSANLGAETTQQPEANGLSEASRGELPSESSEGNQPAGEQAAGGAGQQLLPAGAQAGDPDGLATDSAAGPPAGKGSDREGGAAGGAGGTGRAPGTTAAGAPTARPSAPGFSKRATAGASQGETLRLPRLASGAPGTFPSAGDSVLAGGVSGPTALGRAQSPLPALPARYDAVVARYVAGSVEGKAQTEIKP